LLISNASNLNEMFHIIAEKMMNFTIFTGQILSSASFLY